MGASLRPGSPWGLWGLSGSSTVGQGVRRLARYASEDTGGLQGRGGLPLTGWAPVERGAA